MLERTRNTKKYQEIPRNTLYTTYVMRMKDCSLIL